MLQHCLAELAFNKFKSNINQTTMKTIAVLLASMMSTIFVFGQNPVTKNVEVTRPAFSGVFPESINEYLAENIEYPIRSKERNIEGTAVVEFVVSEKGTLSNIKIINSITPEIDSEVLRILKLTDNKWTPGTQNGQPVAMKQEVSAAFKLYPTSDFVKMARYYYHRGSKMLFVKHKTRKALRLLIPTIPCQ